MLIKQNYIPEPEEIIAEKPLTSALETIKKERDAEIKDVLTGKSKKLLVVVGPCSAHDSASTLEYVARLGKVHTRVKDKLVLVPRIYTCKPRTKGVGYMGMLMQPNPEGGVDVVQGIRTARALHIAALELSGLSAADEMLYPENAAYLEDLLSYHAVGARSVENQLHRQVASGMDAPVGMKNPMSGNLTALMNSIYAAQSPQTFKYRNYQVSSEGNPYAHAILRGGVDGTGADVPNFHHDRVEKIAKLYQENGLKNPAVIVDCNHSNSGKDFKRQISIAQEVMQSRQDKALSGIIKGVMLESFLVEGNQPHNEVFGQSITDPCLGWEDTERLLMDIAEKV